MHLKLPPILVCAVGIWICLIGIGFACIQHFETTPGTHSRNVVSGDFSKDRLFSTTSPTLIMAIHPQCPCTRASFTQLEYVLAHSPQTVQTIVLFVVPKGLPLGWEKTEFWDRTLRLPNALAVVDYGGEEANRLGAETSGHCFLYDTKRQRLFSGGITVGRGHEGINQATELLIGILHHKITSEIQTSVYGCPL